MKKFLSLLILFILFIPLYASVSFSGDVDDYLRIKIEEALLKAVGDRREIDVIISDLSVDEDTLSFTVSYGEKRVLINTTMENLEEEIDSLFYYEEDFFEEGSVIDYIYGESFSSVTLTSARRGQNYAVVGTSGKTEALMRVESVYDGAVSFRPYYLSSPLPGMKIERINDFNLTLRAFSSFKFDTYGLSLSFAVSSLIYPMIPFVQIAGTLGNGGMSIYALIGLKGEFNLASVWPGIPVIRNFTFSGEFSFGGLYNGTIKYAGEFALECTYMFNRVFSLTAGLVNYGGTNYMALSCGAKL